MARRVQPGIDVAFQRMDSSIGSKRTSYNSQQLCIQSKRIRDSERIVAPEILDETPLPTTSIHRMSWDVQSTNLLFHVVQASMSQSGIISWESAYTNWKSRSSIPVTQDQLKSKWQHCCSRRQFTTAVALNTSSSSDPLPAEITTPLAESADEMSDLPQQIEHSQLPQLHALSANNFLIAEIAAVVVPQSPSGQPFSKRECEIWDYIMNHCSHVHKQASICWKTFEKYWKTHAAVAILQDRKKSRDNGDVWLRSAAQLKQRNKTIRKQGS